MKELIFKSAHEIKDIDEEKGIVKGLGSVFGNIDSDGDVIVKGAYTKTIKENLPRIKYLYQHRLDKPVGTMKELSETNEGLEFVSQIALKTALGRDVFEMIKAGVITENSVGFSVIKEERDQAESVNYIKEIKLYEISAVTLAANPLALINEIKSKGSEVNTNELINQFITERFDALEALVKSNISNELGLAVEFEIKSLKDLALRNIVTEPNETHSAEELKTIEEEEAFNYILKKL
ncbi:MAG: HK97 family phage prohead protease [Oleispira sp.]|nr:HK97 family phage prohead protease [Oleispira sp.]